MVQTPKRQSSSTSGLSQVNRIILGGYPEDRVEKVAVLLKNLEAKDGQDGYEWCRTDFIERLLVPSEPADAELLRAKLSGDDHNILMMFIENPASVLATALANQESLRDVAGEWRLAVERLLDLAESDEARIQVFALDEVLSSPAGFAELLSRDFGLKLSVIREHDGERRRRLRDFYLLTANQYIREHPDLSDLAAKLEKKRKFIPVFRPSLEVDWSRSLDDVNAIRDENALMFEQLHKLQVDFEHNFFRLTESERKNRELIRELAEMKGLRKKLQKVYSSTSWKITRPVRAVSFLIRRLKGGR